MSFQSAEELDSETEIEIDVATSETKSKCKYLFHYADITFEKKKVLYYKNWDWKQLLNCVCSVT